jgi:uncharacterized RDD family membrane protein YckC
MTDTIADQPAPTAARAHAWTDTNPHPWRRYFARSLDMTLFGLVMMALLGAVIALVSAEAVEPFVALLDGMFGRYLIGPVLIVTLSVPLIALSIGLTGGTPGKWLFGVRVASDRGRPIGVAAAFVREVRAVLFGLGLGLPIISLILAWQAQEQLTEQGATNWDEEGGHVVTHRRVNVWQIVLMVIGGAALVAIRFYGMVDQFSQFGG